MRTLTAIQRAIYAAQRAVAEAEHELSQRLIVLDILREEHWAVLNATPRIDRLRTERTPF